MTADTTPTADSPTPDPRTVYSGRLGRHGSARDAAAKRSLRLSNVRAVTFLAAAAALVAFDVLEATAESLALAVAALLIMAFVAQVFVHRRVKREERWEGALADVAQEGLLRLDRDWERLDKALPPAERSLEEPGPTHPYARDLNVTGQASLTRLLGPVTSERGRAILRRWLLRAGSPEAASTRQGAVRELAPLSELRAEYTAHGRLDGPKSLDGLDHFLAWAEEEVWTPGHVGTRVAAWLLPAVVTVGVVAYFAVDFPPWWILPAVVQFELLRRLMPILRKAFAESSPAGPALQALVQQLAALSGREWSDPLLSSLAERLDRGGDPVHQHLERLAGLLDTVESRANMFYAMLAPVLLLDVHLFMALDRWRGAHGSEVRDWLEALGEWEALAALSTLAHDNPDWVEPGFVTGDARELTCTALGHPLLPPDQCVRNDVSVGPPGTFLLVTGSNMSGKSTLLRAIGANVVLASAGAPVCASSLMLPPLRVRTSMRVEDSLAEGISLFMAELLRIKEIVTAADDSANQGHPVLFLLDEVLHGTNTAERRVAARGVIRHLMSVRAIGAVSTHDLSLAEAPDLVVAADAVHFREQVEVGPGGQGTSLTFDYRLREGIATTSNALKLLEAVGLGGLKLEE